jgi:hypothetical protein
MLTDTIDRSSLRPAVTVSYPDHTTTSYEAVRVLQPDDLKVTTSIDRHRVYW